MDIMPRVTTAQKMDILSSTAKVVGFRAVIEAVQHFGRLIGADITAAGKYPPAKVLVIGAGVAGLQAIGDARRLGADVYGFDVRLECQEQVESMGGKFLKMDFDESGAGEGGYAKPMSPEFIAKEMELFAEQAQICDIIITTAAIPGRAAPKLLLQSHVDVMRLGSVVVDVAAASGGNCEITRPGETYVYVPEKDRDVADTQEKKGSGITIVGDVNLAAKAGGQVSDMYSYNLLELVKHMGGGDSFSVNFEDQIIRSITVVHNSNVTWQTLMLRKDRRPFD
eukprot:284816148_3